MYQHYHLHLGYQLSGSTANIIYEWSPIGRGRREGRDGMSLRVIRMHAVVVVPTHMLITYAFKVGGILLDTFERTLPFLRDFGTHGTGVPDRTPESALLFRIDKSSHGMSRIDEAFPWDDCPYAKK